MGEKELGRALFGHILSIALDPTSANVDPRFQEEMALSLGQIVQSSGIDTDSLQGSFIDSIDTPTANQYLRYVIENGEARIVTAPIAVSFDPSDLADLADGAIPATKVGEINLGSLAGSNFFMRELARLEGARQTGFARFQVQTLLYR